jgi:membrane associated rhomboid family serine protease
MSPNYARTSIFYGTPKAGPATRWLCGLLAGSSVLASLLERRSGFETERLIFRAAAVWQGEVWRLLTYAFIKDSALGLMLSGLVLYLFGRTCEGSWGARDFTRFFLLSTVGGAAFAMPLNYAINLALPFHDLGVAAGPDAAIDAMMVALALNAPDAKVMFGFFLPMPAKQIIYVLLGFDVLNALMTGMSSLSITLGGMLMGYFLVTGNWRPSHLLRTIRELRQRRQRRSGLYVVPPKRRTLN